MVSAKFHVAGGPGSVRRKLNNIMANATRSLRCAVCFFTEAGNVLMRTHAKQLQLADSFFVASVEAPTNLKALEKLHRAAPGKVYIHLGGITPEEKTVGRALMHSKVFLAEGDNECTLWVGSHNLTAMGIGGGNIEAAAQLTAPLADRVMQDAIAHLEFCRNTAEIFDPREMDRYRDIQRRSTDLDWDVDNNVLVIHAETSIQPKNNSFLVSIQLVPTQFDNYLQNDRPVRLFLHPVGALGLGQTAAYGQTTLWLGEITAVVRTDLHPKNRGARAQFAAANFDIEVPDLLTPPQMIQGGTSRVRPLTQAVIRIDQQDLLRDELYTVGKSPIENSLAGEGEQELCECEPDLSRFFTPKSISHGMLIYRPVQEVVQEIVIRGYDETVRSRLDLPGDRDDFQLSPLTRTESDDNDDPIDLRRKRVSVRYEFVKPKRAIDPFFYLSKYAIRTRREPS